MKESGKKMLVCGPAWVGDMVMTQSLLKKIRAAYPDAVIDVLAPAWTIALARRMPEVNSAVELAVGHGELKTGRRLAAARDLAKRGYEEAIVCQRSFKAALVPFLARIPIRTGYSGQMRYPLINNPRRLDKTKLPRTVDRLVALGAEKNAKQPPVFENPDLRVDPANRQSLCVRLGLPAGLPAAAFLPGAEYGPAKQWPLQYFRELAKTLVSSGWQVWVMGGPKDIACGRFIAGGDDPRIHNLIGQTRLEDAIDLISLCKAAVTNDSGLMHVASAVGTHVEVLYGCTPPDYTPPLTKRKNVHYLRLPCSPCFKRTCPLGHKNCLRNIPPAKVAESLLAGNKD
ncbi:MAG: lipopolysaccharide heptosyltransferase II [Desulfosalsimonadaceae bacterium]